MQPCRKKRRKKPVWISPPEFDALYNEYKAAVFGFALYLTKNRGEAEDLFQETWLRVVRKMPEKINKESLKAWMFTIVSNIHKDTLRKKRLKNLWFKKVAHSSEDDVSLQGLAGGSPMKTNKEMEISALSGEMTRAISLLPDRQRRVFILKEIAGFKQAEVGEILGLKLGTVKSLMHRAVRRLQNELSAYRPKREKVKCDAKMLSV
jgi:RNA polymerase sigma-70 factor (ECF subfamily)